MFKEELPRVVSRVNNRTFAQIIKLIEDHPKKSASTHQGEWVHS